MRIRTWYNLNHHNYFTDYSQGILEYKVGYINKYNHLLISTVYFKDNKIFYNSEAAEKYFYKKLHGFKYRAKRRLINFIKKL